MRHSPLQLKFCLAFWMEDDPVAALGAVRMSSLTGKETIAWMKGEGLITDALHRTDRLRTFVEHLCSQQLPVAVWRVPS